MKRGIVTLAAALLAIGTANIAGAQGQGQDKNQGKGKPQAEQPVQLPSHGPDKGKDSVNHGQVVSECNHRATERNLKGHERKDFVEWCESRGPRYKYDYGRYGNERNCYQKADNKGLTGQKRANFLAKCFDDVEIQHYGGKVRVQKD